MIRRAPSGVTSNCGFVPLIDAVRCSGAVECLNTSASSSSWRATRNIGSLGSRSALGTCAAAMNGSTKSPASTSGYCSFIARISLPASGSILTSYPPEHPTLPGPPPRTSEDSREFLELRRTPSLRSSTSEEAYSAQWGEKAVASAPRSRTSATPGIQLPALETLLHVSPGSVYQLGVDEDLLYLGLGAVAAHVLLLEHLSEAGSPLQAVDDVLEDLLLTLRLGSFSRAADQRIPERPLLGHWSRPPPPAPLTGCSKAVPVSSPPITTNKPRLPRTLSRRSSPGPLAPVQRAYLRRGHDTSCRYYQSIMYAVI